MIRKITFVVFSLRGGGAERVVSQLANELSSRANIEVVQLSDLDPFYTLHEQVKLHKYSGPDRGFFRFFYMALYLYRLLRTSRPDVVVSFGETISPFVILVAKLARKRVVVSNRASPLSSLVGRRSKINPILYPFADVVLVQTKRAVEILSEKFNGCSWMVLENPVNYPVEVPGIKERKHVCVTVGYLGGQKNQTEIIRAFAKVAGDEWELVVIGDGPDRNKLEVLAGDLGLEEKIKFMGEVKKVEEILLSAKVFMFTSRSEGFPNALAEAMACGCACIAYDCMTGPAELLGDSEAGVLVDIDDFDNYCVSLKELLSDDALQSKFSADARRRTELLKPSRIAGDFIDRLEKAI